MNPLLFQAGMQMLQGTPLSEGGASETEPSLPSMDTAVDVTATLTGGAMTTSFGGQGTNWLVILGVVAVIFILAK